MLDYQEMHNGGANSHPEKASSKRKLHEEQQSCSLFAEDFQSQAKDEKIKKFLEREASSFLRTCGWSDEVHSFMVAKKKFARDASRGGNELKRMLIADAKSTFISRIPESLKSELIEHLTAFSQDTTHVDP